MVEVVGVEVVYGDTRAARADKGIGMNILVKEGFYGGHVLIRKVPAHDARIGGGIIRLADAGQQHQVHVMELESRNDDDIRGLFDLVACEST